MVKHEWHSARRHVYHNHPNCTTGNNIENPNIRKGRGKRTRLCKECKRLGEMQRGRKR